MASVLPFSLNWYLSQNPDVAKAVNKGLIGAFEHFEMYGKAEGRSPNPLFNPAKYLDDNPDVAVAMVLGETTAYDHFVAYGAREGRSPFSLFDEAFYLLQNPDVAEAVKAGAMTAVQHFLMYGQSEPRPFNVSIDLGKYLKANADVALAVEAGSVTALGHLMTYGASESRDLGNGVHLADFAKDPTFNAALAAGRFEIALGRVGEVAPFLPTFEKPAGWTIPANTPIPTGFVPVGGKYLVIPEGFKVPEGTKLPDAFGPATPVIPPGDGGSESPKAFALTTDKDEFVGTTKNDTFAAVAKGSLQMEDNLDGGGSGDKDLLSIAAGAMADGARPSTNNIEVINNADVGAFTYQDGLHVMSKTLDLARVTGVKEIWTDFKGTGFGVHYKNTSSDTEFGISNAGKTSNSSYVVIAPADVTGSDTKVKIALENNAVGSQIFLMFNDAVTSSGVEHVEIDVAENSNAGVLFVASDKIESLTITGAGNVHIGDAGSPAASPTSLVLFDASKATGQVSWVSGALVDEAKVSGGSGDDNFNFSAVDHGVELTIDGGAGNDIIIGGKGNDTITAGTGVNTLTGGAGADTFVLEVKRSNLDKLDSITDFEVGKDTLRFGDVAMKLTEGSNTRVTISPNTYDGLLTYSQGWFVKGVSFVIGFVEADAYVFYNAEIDGTADTAYAAVKLTGVIISEFKLG